MKTSANDAALRAADIKRTQMKNVPLVAVLFTVAIAALVSQRAMAEEGVAVAIIYDTSGSMKDPVKDQSGRQSPKYVIANRALIAIAKQIQTFATHSASGGQRKIEAGVFIFDKKNAREAGKFLPFHQPPIYRFSYKFLYTTRDNTLGNALPRA